MSPPAPAVVVVGAGLMGRWHAHAIRALGGRVVGVVDRDVDRAHALAARYRTQASTTLQTFLDPAPTAVHICTPVDSHRELVSLALEAGANVLVEKPFAPTAPDAEAILELATARGLVACPVHQFPFQHGFRRAVDRLSGLGRLLHVDMVACSAGADATPDRRGKVALEILPHALSIAHRFGNHSVDTISWQATATGPGEYRLAGATDATTFGILVSMSGRPTRNALRLVAERGTIHLDLFHGYSVVEDGSVSRRSKIARPFALAGTTVMRATTNLVGRALGREPAYPGLRELIRQFHQASEGSGPPPISADETLAISRAADRIAAVLLGGGR